MQEICLRIKNHQSLKPYCHPYCIFNNRGGSIGSGSDNAWAINDINNTIQSIQASISFEEGIFGLKPYDKECKIFLNDSFSPLPYSYETQIDLGDYFKIGDLEIEIIRPQDLAQESNKTQSLSDLGELKPYNQLDSLDIQQKGVEENFNPIEEETIDLLDHDNDILGLNPNQNISSTPLFQTIKNDYFITPSNLKAMIFQKAQDLQNKLCSNACLKFNAQKLKMLDLQLRLEHFSLLENKELLNLLVLFLLTEALQNPMLQSIYPDFFEKSISEILEECINGNVELLHKTLLSILQMRCQDEG